MNAKLGEADQRAVDLVLDQTGPLSRGEKDSARFQGTGGDETMQRVSAVQQVLTLLDQLPTPPVPANLAERTLQRVRQAPTALAPANTQAKPATKPGHQPPIS